MFSNLTSPYRQQGLDVGIPKAFILLLFLLVLKCFAGKSGIQAIDSLPVNDWRSSSKVLTYPSALAASLLPGGAQIYGGHPVRAGFLIALEGYLFTDALYGKPLFLKERDRDSRSSMDSALLYLNQPSQNGKMKAFILASRRNSDLRITQQDLANSELAWALGLHLYGMLDGIEIVWRSRNPDTTQLKASTALWLGLIFPGGGQLYNHAYGKFGLLWMSFIGGTVATLSRQQVVEYYDRRIKAVRTENAAGENIEDLARLERGQTLYRKRRNQYYWAMGLFYIYACLDGMADAAFSDFDSPKRLAETKMLPNWTFGPGIKPFSVEWAMNF